MSISSAPAAAAPVTVGVRICLALIRTRSQTEIQHGICPSMSAATSHHHQWRPRCISGRELLAGGSLLRLATGASKVQGHGAHVSGPPSGAWRTIGGSVAATGARRLPRAGCCPSDWAEGGRTLPRLCEMAPADRPRHLKQRRRITAQAGSGALAGVFWVGGPPNGGPFRTGKLQP